MPSGRAHLRIELGALVLITGAGVGLNHVYQYVKWGDATAPGLCFLGAYLFSSLLMSPDMDLVRSRPQSRWGVFRLLWLPYAVCFRHWGISHNLVFGPMTRIVYLALVVCTVLALLHYSFGVELGFLEHWREDLYSVPLWAIGVGLFLPNELHILVDKVIN